MRNISPSRVLILPGTRYQKNPEEEDLQFDRLPPYFLHSCRSFTFDDLMRAEQLAVNTRVILNFVHEQDRVFLAERGLDIVEMAEDIHELYPEWLSMYERRSLFDTEVFCRRPEVCDIISAYIELKMESDEASVFMSSILALRQAQHSYTNNNPLMHVKEKEKAAPDKTSNILEHHFVPFPYDYCSYVKSPRSIPPPAPPENAFCFVSLHPAYRKGHVYQSPDIYVAARIIDALKKQKSGVTLAETYDENKNGIGVGFSNFMDIVQGLSDNGIIDIHS